MSYEQDQLGLSKSILKIVSFSESEIVDLYSKSAINIKSKMLDIHNKYQVKGSLTYGEMMKYSRLNNFLSDINVELKSLNAKEFSIINNTSLKVFNETYYKNWYLLEKGNKISVNLGKLNPDYIKGQIEIPFSGNTLKEIIKNKGVNAESLMRKEITQGLIQGESLPKITKRLDGFLNSQVSKAKRIATTETLRASSLSEEEFINRAEKAGADFEVVWKVTQDGRDRHGYMNDQVRDKNKLFHLSGGITGPQPRLTGTTEDIYCRCYTIKRVNNIDDFKSVEMEKSYEEWL